MSNTRWSRLRQWLAHANIEWPWVVAVLFAIAALTIGYLTGP